MIPDTFAGIRYSWYCRPLAIVLAVLMLGPIPEFLNLPLIPRTAAQGVTVCTLPTGQSKIVQTGCPPESLEKNAVQDFLLSRGIPATEAPLLYQYGRRDLRSEVRADVFVSLVEIINKVPASRTTDEQAVYDWFQKIVWEHQKEQYEAAILDRDHWKANPCNWRPDSDVAAQYNLSYDGSRWCAAGNNLSGLFSVAPPVPSKDYFLTAALKKSYGTKVAATDGGPAVLSNLFRDVAAAAGISALGGLAVAGGIGAGLGITALVHGGLVSATTGNFLLAGAAATGPALIIITAVLIGVVATFQVFEQQRTLSQLTTLTTDYNWVLENKPVLESYVNNNAGYYKLSLSFAANAMPDFPSSAVPPGRRAGDRNFWITPQGGSPAASPTFSYTDWEGTRWTAGPSGGWITGQGVKTDNSPVYDFGVSFKFRDWNNGLYRATRKGLYFVVTKLLPASNDVVCAPGPGGISTGDLSNCKAYVTNALNLLDGDGRKVTVQFTTEPAFSSGTTFTLDKTTARQINITADGIPAPTISLTSAVPSGFTFGSSGPGSAQISYNGQGSEGSYTFSLRADGPGASVSQTVTVLISVPVKIQAYDGNVYAGQSFKRVVVAAGSPVPALSCTNRRGNFTFTDNGDGTATFAGTAPEYASTDLAGNPNLLPFGCDLTATNSLMSDTSSILFSAVAAPLATITSPMTVTWATDRVNVLRVTTSGAITPVKFSLPCGSPGAWLNLKDNGDGTAILSGQPSAVVNPLPSWTFVLYASTGDKPVCGSPNFRINVKFMPSLPDPMHYFLTAGVPTYGISNVFFGYVGSGSVTGTPPPGVQFTGIQGGWKLDGTPEVGSGGVYDMLYTSTGATGDSVSGIFQLFVQEPPQIVSQNSATFRAGEENIWIVDTTGFPKVEIPGLRAPMRVTTEGMLPPGVVFSDTNTLGIATGAGVLKGNPPASARGSYPLTFRAVNGVGDAAAQNFTLVIAIQGDANNDGSVNCSDMDLVGSAFGHYRGTPKYVPLADFNGDGVVDFADSTIVESHLPAGTTCVFSMAFSTMTAALSAKGKSGNFDLTAAFTLGHLSTGIDPANEPFAIQVGAYNLTLPVGSFKVQQKGAKQGAWVYDGKNDGVSLSIQIEPTGTKAFLIKASASGGNKLETLPPVVPVKIRIGDDSGAISVPIGK